jgi:phage tail tape-measure protein
MAEPGRHSEQARQESLPEVCSSAMRDLLCLLCEDLDAVRTVLAKVWRVLRAWVVERALR